MELQVRCANCERLIDGTSENSQIIDGQLVYWCNKAGCQVIKRAVNYDTATRERNYEVKEGIVYLKV